MNCPSLERLIELIVAGRDGESAEREHVRHCPACTVRLTEIEGGLERVAAAHRWLDRGHAAGRRRLLSSLAAEPARRPKSRVLALCWEVLVMKRTWMSAAAAVLVVVGLVVWNVWQPASALAQATKAMRDAKSYQCQVSWVTPPENGEAEKVEKAGRFSWAAPGSIRMEMSSDGKPESTLILPHGQQGVNIDHREETFERLPPNASRETLVQLLMNLANFSGRPDRDLGEAEIEKKKTVGFEVAVEKAVPDLKDPGTVRVWVDTQSKRPVRIEITMELLKKHTQRFDEFAWDVPADGWFDVTPPNKYEDKTPTPTDVNETTDKIVQGLKTYHKFCGTYPKVKNVYGDVSQAELYRNAGVDPKNPPVAGDAYQAYLECLNNGSGLGWINMIQRHNPDAVYNGKTVGAEDKGKVLLRWKLETGDYRVIYGDLRAETVSEAKLKELEKAD